MFRSRALAGSFVVGALAAASVFSAVPASAATLPGGQQITVVDYFEWQFSAADPATAVLTPIGTGSPDSETQVVTAVDVDDDGHGYALTTDYETELVICEDEDPECVPINISEAVGAYLRTADAKSGVLGAGTAVQIVTGPLEEPVLAPADECLALDYSKGALLAACNIYDEEFGDSAWIGTIDPATAILTPSVLLFDEDFIAFEAIAIDPVTGTIWGFNAFGDVFTITLDAAEPDYIGSLEMAVYAADFDRGGQLWASAYRDPAPADRAIEPGEEGLVTVDLESGEFPFNAVWSDPDATIDALTVWGKESLAATGQASSPAVALGAGALLLFGALLAAGSLAMRRTRES